MFNAAGQVDHLTFAGVRGGGKGGGGGSSQPQMPQPRTLVDPVTGMAYTDDPQTMAGPWGYMMNPAGSGKTAAQQLNEAISTRQASDKATSDAAAAQATADAATKESTFQTNRQGAYDTAMQQVMRQFQLQGVDPTNYMSTDITPALQRQFQSVQDLDPNPTAAFPTNLGDTIIGNITSGKRTQATNALNQTFSPNYSQNLLPDTLTGQYSGDIVNEQFNPLMDQLTNASKRGTLTPAGYQAALDALNQKKTAAMSTVNTLGQGILATDRSGLDDYISGARTAASNVGLSDTFDPSTYAGTAAGKAQTDIAGFGGALRNAVGDTKFADIQDLINAGGAVQGSNNPTAANPQGTASATSPAYVAPDDLAAQKRGLGNVGAF
jgi:hypothetical protein